MVSKRNPREAASSLVANERPWKTGVSYSLISMVVGLFVVLLIGLGDPDLYTPVQFAFGALFGLLISAGAWSFEYFLLYLARGRFPHLPLRVLGYFLGGGVGHLATYGVTALVFGDASWDETNVLFRTILFSFFAAAVGLIFYAFEVLRRRLGEREAELRKSELASALAESELEIARSIQQRLLPPPEAEGPGFRVAARNVAAQVVAGDFYDVLREGDQSLCVVVGDVAGKGVGASLIMASVKAVLPLMATGRTVEAIMNELNEKLFQELASREFVALAMARIDLESGEVELANAGLPDPCIVRSGKEVEPMEVPGQRLPLGARAGTRYQALSFKLMPGERLLVYTDGLPEARHKGAELGYEGFHRLIAKPADTPSSWLDGILTALEDRVAEEDDRTLLALEWSAPESAAIVGAATQVR